MTHTKGPWEVAEYGDGKIFVINKDSMKGVIAFQYVDNEARENAKLIAAAPDLLVALEEMLEMSDTPPERNCSCHINGPCSDCVEHSALRHARALAEDALSKARGQS